MRGGYSPARGLQNTNPQWVVAPVEKKTEVSWVVMFHRAEYKYKNKKSLKCCLKIKNKITS